MIPEQIHKHKRKRIHKYKEPYPNPDPRIKFLDQVVSWLAFIFPVTVVPQIIRIWYYKETEGVSLITWTLFLIFTGMLLVYAIVHKEKRLVVMWGLFAVSYLLVILGILIN